MVFEFPFEVGDVLIVKPIGEEFGGADGVH